MLLLYMLLWAAMLPQLRTCHHEELTCIRGSLFLIPHNAFLIPVPASKPLAKHCQRTPLGSSLLDNIHRQRNLLGSSPPVPGVRSFALRSQLW